MPSLPTLSNTTPYSYPITSIPRPLLFFFTGLSTPAVPLPLSVSFLSPALDWKLPEGNDFAEFPSVFLSGEQCSAHSRCSTMYMELINNRPELALLSPYCVPGLVVSALLLLADVILPTTLGGGFCYYPVLQAGELRSKRLCFWLRSHLLRWLSGICSLNTAKMNLRDRIGPCTSVEESHGISSAS